MSEKPILFSTDMTRAILDGRKTQTRRVIRPRYSNTVLKMFTNKYGTRLVEIEKETPPTHNPDGTTTRKIRAARDMLSKYAVGDTLWVREAWCEAPYECRHVSIHGGHMTLPVFAYRADSEVDYTGIWRPSIHMPRAAARLFLRVTDVRAERLRDISNADCMREGLDADLLAQNCEYILEADLCMLTSLSDPTRTEDCGNCANTKRNQFKRLWDSLNAKRGFGWDTNPWVWVVGFEVMKDER
jgi:hypothetical protein